MRRGYGLVIAGESNSLEQGQAYDSRKYKYAVDTEAQEPHFQLLEDFSGGTKFVLPQEIISTEEILLRVRHNMPFKPHFICWIAQTQLPTALSGTFAKQFSLTRSFMLYNAIGLGEEELYADVDETYFYIKHKASRFGYGDPGNFTFYGSDFKFQIRFMIFGIPSYLIDGGVVPD